MALSARSVTRSAVCRSRSSSVRVQAAAWTKVSTKDAVTANGGKLVVELADKSRVLLVIDDSTLYAVSNKCSHLGLPLVGKTPVFQAKIENKCVICPVHNTAFNLKTGEVEGEWCPKFPDLPFVGKLTPSKPLPTFESRYTASGEVEVFV
ncbi:MAG: hypothetical protein WDW38_011450 [Sanguina aurantia]